MKSQYIPWSWALSNGVIYTSPTHNNSKITWTVLTLLLDGKNNYEYKIFDLVIENSFISYEDTIHGLAQSHPYVMYPKS